MFFRKADAVIAGPPALEVRVPEVVVRWFAFVMSNGRPVANRLILKPGRNSSGHAVPETGVCFVPGK
jgi:hypothetical protein